MKEKILNALTTKFEGVKADILDRIASKAAKNVTTDEEVATYIEGVTIQSIMDAYADSRATDATKTAILNYEKKHNIKDGKAIEQPAAPAVVNPKDKQPATDNNIPVWAQAILDSNKAMQERLDKMDGEKETTSRKAMLDKVLDGAPESVKQMHERTFARMQFKDVDDFSAYLDEVKSDVTTIKDTLTSKQAIITPPKAGGSPQGAVSAAVQARIDAMAKANESTPSAIKG